MDDVVRVSPPLSMDQKTAVVGVAETRRHLRISSTDEDRLLAEDIEAAYDFLSGPDGWLGRACLLEEEWIAYFPSAPNRIFEIPMRPLVTLTGIGWLQPDGSYVDVEGANYYVTGGAFSVVQRAPASWWPYSGMPQQRAYQVRFRAGWGTTKESIPSTIRKAIRMLVGHWYNQRETTGSEGRTAGREVEYGLKKLCGRYRIGPDHS